MKYIGGKEHHTANLFRKKNMCGIDRMINRTICKKVVNLGKGYMGDPCAIATFKV